MHVFLTGATGFVGHEVLKALLAHNHSVRCLIREEALDKLPILEDQISVVDSSKDQLAEGEEPAQRDPSVRVEVVYGDIQDLDSIDGDMNGCDAVIHLVGIIDEDRRTGKTFENVHVRGTRNVVEEAKAAGIERFIHMSANGARGDRDASRYHSTKWQAEEIVREAGFPHTVIFRPSIIFGDPDGRVEFATRLAQTLIRSFPVVPVLGNGRYQLQPIHISDVANAFAQSVTLSFEEGIPNEYEVGGLEAITFDEALDRIARGMDRKPPGKVHLPLWFAKVLINTVGAAGLLPISPAQFRMLIEGNTTDNSAFIRDFTPKLIPFEVENLRYLSMDNG